MKLFNRKLEETYMFDFIINLFAEIADFFFTFWADNVIDKFAKRKKYLPVCKCLNKFMKKLK